VNIRLKYDATKLSSTVARGISTHSFGNIMCKMHDMKIKCRNMSTSHHRYTHDNNIIRAATETVSTSTSDQSKCDTYRSFHLILASKRLNIQHLMYKT